MTAAGLSNLVVEVLHNRGDDNRPDWSVGSGFFVGSSLVLTALHNVDGPGELLVRVHGTEERRAVVRLQGDKDIIDLAVLEVSDVAMDIPPLRYGMVDQSAAGAMEQCWAVGFPRFKERVHDPKPLRLSGQVNGEIPTGENLNQPLLTLLVRRSPRPLPSRAVPESEWAGMSGAAVFSGNNILVGVITEHHLPEGESALTVVPITALDLLPEAEATKWWKLLGVNHQALVRLPGTDASPFMPADLPAGFVPRPHEFVELKKSLLRGPRNRPTAITSALLGAGGYGKTMLALALCHDQEIQDAFPDGILWVTLGVQPSNLVGKIEDLVYFLRRERPSFTSREAAMAKLREALAERTCLLVIDDVWHVSHLTPFLQGGPRCARLITTRIDQILPPSVQCMPVDAMRQEEAVQLLQTGLDREPGEKEAQLIRQLAKRLGEWPLLLALANGVLRERVGRLREPLPTALTYLQRALEKRGVVAFDARNARERTEAVTRTVEVSLEQLSPDECMRFEELAIFPEDVTIPLATVHSLWKVTGNLDELATEDLCQQLYSFSLLLSCDLQTRSIRLHDVIRNYLQLTVRARLPVLHGYLLDSYGLQRWAELAPDERYLWEHLAKHLIAAGRANELRHLLLDFDWLQAKLDATSPAAMIADYEHFPDDQDLQLVRGAIRLSLHILAYDKSQLRSQLYGRLLPHEAPTIKRMLELGRQAPSMPWLRPLSLSLMPPGGPLHLTLPIEGTERLVISHDGRRAIAFTRNHRTSVWDLDSGRELGILDDHRSKDTTVEELSDGTRIIFAENDSPLEVWSPGTAQGPSSLELTRVKMAAVIVKVEDLEHFERHYTVKVEDLEHGEKYYVLNRPVSKDERSFSLIESARILGIASTGQHVLLCEVIRQPESWRPTWSRLSVWDLERGEELQSISVSQEGLRVWHDLHPLVIGSHDGSLVIWDRAGEIEIQILKDHIQDIVALAVTPDGKRMISADFLSLKVWNLEGWKKSTLIRCHRASVDQVSVTPDGQRAVSIARDYTHIAWDAKTGRQLCSLDWGKDHGNDAGVRGLAITFDGRHALWCNNYSVTVWDLETGRTLNLVGPKYSYKYLSTFAVTEDGRVLAQVYDSTFVIAWDLETGAELPRAFPGQEEERELVRDGIYTPDRRYLAGTYSPVSPIYVRDLQTKATFEMPHSAIGRIAIAPDGKYILTSSTGDRTIKVWDVEHGTLLYTLLWSHKEALTWFGGRPPKPTREPSSTLSGGALEESQGSPGIGTSPDGKYGFSFYFDGTLRVWELESGKPITHYTAEVGLSACAAASDGLFVAGDDIGRVHFLQLEGEEFKSSVK
jgi:WD40 repeat protein